MSRPGPFERALGRRPPDPTFVIAACALEMGITLEAMGEMRVRDLLAALRKHRAAFDGSKPVEIEEAGLTRAQLETACGGISASDRPVEP
jgi:hypothetical protein